MILTTAANESISPLHDRMPVILGSNEIEPWLSDGETTGKFFSRPGPQLVLELVS